MAKRKLDNLDRDTAEALRLGYGVHYGRYKADHPHTKEPVKAPPEPMGVCRHCGKPFPTKGRHYRKLYCDDECRMAYNQSKPSKALPTTERPPIRKVHKVGEYTSCAECGKLFIPVRKGNIFCSPACSARQRQREKYRHAHGYYEKER